MADSSMDESESGDHEDAIMKHLGMPKLAKTLRGQNETVGLLDDAIEQTVESSFEQSITMDNSQEKLT